MFDRFDPTDRIHFLNLAAVMEGSLIVIAFVCGWLAEAQPLHSLQWQWDALVWGVVGTVPLFGLFLLSYRFPIGPLFKIKRFLVEMLGPSLVACRWYDLVLLALLAGFSEELLFRGVLQPWFGQGKFGSSEFLIGLIGSNILFGLAHTVTPTYAILAALVGVYLGVLRQATGSPNLIAPMVTHGLYDYFAFLVVAHTYRSEQSIESHQELPEEDQDDPGRKNEGNVKK